VAWGRYPACRPVRSSVLAPYEPSGTACRWTLGCSTPNPTYHRCGDGPRSLSRPGSESAARRRRRPQASFCAGGATRRACRVASHGVPCARLPDPSCAEHSGILSGRARDIRVWRRVGVLVRATVAPKDKGSFRPPRAVRGAQSGPIVDCGATCSTYPLPCLSSTFALASLPCLASPGQASPCPTKPGLGVLASPCRALPHQAEPSLAQPRRPCPAPPRVRPSGRRHHVDGL